MFRQKYLCVMLIVMMFFVISSGGCGGGNSGLISQKESDNHETEYDISILQGKWTASNGTCKATWDGENFEMRMIHVNAVFTDVQVIGDKVTAVVSTSSEWEADLDDEYSIMQYDDKDKEVIEIKHIEGDTWCYTLQDDDETVTATITITSETTADVIEEVLLSDGSQYTANYTLIKDDPDSLAMKYDIKEFEGTWIPSSGGGIASGNGESLELEITSGSITLSNLELNVDTLTGDLSGSTSWDVYQDGTRISEIGLSFRKFEVHHLSGNTWRTGNGRSTTTLLSQTSVSNVYAGIIDIEGKKYNFSIIFGMKKN